MAVVTAVADVYGTGLAGFAGGIPSTGPVSLLFIGWSQSQSAAIQAAAGFPLGFSVTFAFLLFYALPKRGRFGVRMTVALLLWFLLATVVVFSGLSDFLLAVAVSILMALTVFAALRMVGIKDAPPVPSAFSAERLAWRGVLGGAVVAGVVLLSAVAGPLAGGVFAATPAIWTTSLYLTNRFHGLEFSRSLAKSLIKVGMLTIVPYGFAVRYLFMDVGIWWGTLLTYIAISPMAWLAWKLTPAQGAAGDAKSASGGSPNQQEESQ